MKRNEEISNIANVSCIPIHDRDILNYLFYSIKIFLKSNYTKTNWGTGDIRDVILNSLYISKLIPEINMDKKQIKEMMKKFYMSSPVGTRNLDEIEREYLAIQEEVDVHVYSCYGLSSNEIEEIEKYIKDQSYKVSRTA